LAVSEAALQLASRQRSSQIGEEEEEDEEAAAEEGEIVHLEREIAQGSAKKKKLSIYKKICITKYKVR